ncbi:MAG: PadR family transcriptional regulator [Phycisphaeraceae bacterium]|nr:PadR family transcriptional regulator [Phycisphaeraceae bacterium]
MLKKQTLDGNIETILLAILRDGPSYGYQIIQDINTRANGLLRLGEGTVYPVLHRLEEKGLLAATWRQGDTGRKRKYYRLSPKGKTALAANIEQWHGLTELILRVVINPARQAVASSPL